MPCTFSVLHALWPVREQCCHYTLHCCVGCIDWQRIVYTNDIPIHTLHKQYTYMIHTIDTRSFNRYIHIFFKIIEITWIQASREFHQWALPSLIYQIHSKVALLKKYVGPPLEHTNFFFFLNKLFNLTWWRKTYHTHFEIWLCYGFFLLLILPLGGREPGSYINLCWPLAVCAESCD